MFGSLAAFWRRFRVDLADSAHARAMDVYARKNEPGLARALLLECLNKGDDSPNVLICLSACEAHLDPHSPEADKWISLAKEKGALQHQLIHATYFLAVQRGNNEAAAKLARELAEIEPTADLLELLCCALSKTDPIECERVARILVDRFPGHPAGFFGLAAVAESREDSAAYLHYMRIAEQLAPERADIQFSLGQAHCSNENYEDAIICYAQSLRLHYEPAAEVYVGLAICTLRGTKNVSRAKKYCRLALAEIPGHEEATQLLAECNQVLDQS